MHSLKLFLINNQLVVYQEECKVVIAFKALKRLLERELLKRLLLIVYFISTETLTGSKDLVERRLILMALEAVAFGFVEEEIK